MIEDGLTDILHRILYPIFLLKIWLQEMFQETPENQTEFTTLEMVYYLNDHCEGYAIDATIYGVTDWSVIMDALEARYSLVGDSENIRDEVGEGDARLDVRYEIMGQRYHIVYQRGSDPHIVYPPYTVDELREFMSTSTALVSIIHAERDGDDLTDLVTEYAGPKGNFYEDKEGIVIKGDWIFRDPSDSRGRLAITDGECKDYLFPTEQAIGLGASKFLLTQEPHRVFQSTSLPSLAVERLQVVHPYPSYQPSLGDEIYHTDSESDDTQSYLQAVNHVHGLLEYHIDSEDHETEEQETEDSDFVEYHSDGFSIVEWNEDSA